jgi:hypothetical protein
VVFYFSTRRDVSGWPTKTKPNQPMNTTPTNELTTTPHRGGNSVTESENLIGQLCEQYLEAGLTLGDAWDAALADYAHLFNRAA